MIFLIILWMIFSALFYLSLIKPIYIDEGVFLTIGKGIAQGKRMYIDFWDHKTPGIHYLWALLFPLFSTKVILYKLFLWLINFFTAGLIYLISEKLHRGSGKFSSLFFLLSLVFLEGNYLSAGPFLAFFLTLAVFLLFPEKKKSYLPILSGVSLALAFIFKQVALLNLPLFLIYFIITKRYRDILFFLAGVFTPIILMLLSLSQVGVVDEFRQQVFGTTNYPSETFLYRLTMWLETFSRIWWLWLAFLVGLFTKVDRKRKWFLILMILIPFFFFMRHYPHYWLQVVPFMAIFAGIGFVAILNYWKKFWYLILALLTLIVISLFSSMLWFKWVTDHKNMPKAIEEESIVKELGSIDYDKLLVENRYTGFYFLADKEPLTKFLYRTEVNEQKGSKDVTFESLKNSHKVVILWPQDQSLVYSKDIGSWLEKNTQKLNYYPELDLVIYFKN